jgi:hypothetical protein
MFTNEEYMKKENHRLTIGEKIKENITKSAKKNILRK